MKRKQEGKWIDGKLVDWRGYRRLTKKNLKKNLKSKKRILNDLS